MANIRQLMLPHVLPESFYQRKYLDRVYTNKSYLRCFLATTLRSNLIPLEKYGIGSVDLESMTEIQLFQLAVIAENEKLYANGASLEVFVQWSSRLIEMSTINYRLGSDVVYVNDETTKSGVRKYTKLDSIIALNGEVFRTLTVSLRNLAYKDLKLKGRYTEDLSFTIDTGSYISLRALIEALAENVSDTSFKQYNIVSMPPPTLEEGSLVYDFSLD